MSTQIHIEKVKESKAKDLDLMTFPWEELSPTICFCVPMKMKPGKLQK